MLGKKGSLLIGIYSHMIAPSYIYLPEYPIGHLIAFQLEQKLRGEAHGREFERVSKFGAVTPDAWMINATGKPVVAGPLLEAAARALDAEEAASAATGAASP